jgi:hypothetical protein
MPSAKFRMTLFVVSGSVALQQNQISPLCGFTGQPMPARFHHAEQLIQINR